MKPERWRVRQAVDLLAAFTELTGRDAIRVREWSIRATQLISLIRRQRGVAFIQHLIHPVPNGGTEGEKIPNEWRSRFYVLACILERIGRIGRARSGLPSVAVHDCHNTEGRDEHGEELAKLPVELEEPHREDVCEEGIRVPDRSNIAESVTTWNVSRYLSLPAHRSTLTEIMKR